MILLRFSFLFVLISKNEKYMIGIKLRIYCKIFQKLPYFYIRWWAVLLVRQGMCQPAHFIANFNVSYTLSTNQIFLFWNESNYIDNGKMVDFNITSHIFEICEWKYMLLENKRENKWKICGQYSVSTKQVPGYIATTQTVG